MRPRHLALIVAVGTGWGSTFLFIEVAMPALGPEATVALRNVFAALTLLVVAAGARIDLRQALRRPGLAVFAGALGLTLPLLLNALAQQDLPTGVVAVIGASAPMLLATAAPWLLPSDRLHRGGVAGLLIGLVGVGLAAGDGAGDGVGLIPVALVLGAALANITYPIIVGRCYRDEDPVVLTLEVALGAAAGSLVLLALFPPSRMPADALAATVALGSVSTALPFIAFAALIAAVGPLRASLAHYVIPVAALVLGVVVLGEAVRGAAIAGLVLICAGVWLATRRHETPSPRRHTTEGEVPCPRPLPYASGR